MASEEGSNTAVVMNAGAQQQQQQHVSVNIDLDGLVDEMSAAKLEVDRFVARRKLASDERQGEFRASVASYEESKKQLAEDMSALDAREAAAHALHTQQKRDIAECRAEIAQLRVEEQALPAHLQVLKAEESKQLENIASATAAANERQKEHKFELNQLTRGIVFYKRLGLELESIEPSDSEEGRMRMVFTRVDPYDAERMFSFTLGVNQHNEFELVECDPVVSGTAELCANLRATSNLTRFAVGMRKKFKEYTLREEHK